MTARWLGLRSSIISQGYFCCVDGTERHEMLPLPYKSWVLRLSSRSSRPPARTRRLVEMRRMRAGSQFGKLTAPSSSGYNQ